MSEEGGAWACKQCFKALYWADAKCKVRLEKLVT